MFIIRGLRVSALLCLLGGTWLIPGKVASQTAAEAPPEIRKIDRNDEWYGLRQLFRLFSDRPEMVRFPSKSGVREIELNGPLCEWAIRKLAGEDTGFRILWDAMPPGGGAPAAHTVRRKGRSVSGIVRLRAKNPGGRKRAFDALWSDLIYELHNISRTERFSELRAQAKAGEITMTYYVVEAARCEFDASIETKAFYETVWKPWAEEVELIESGKANWGHDLINEFPLWMALHTDRDSFPWVPYAEYYEKWQKERSRKKLEENQ